MAPPGGLQGRQRDERLEKGCLARPLGTVYRERGKQRRAADRTFGSKAPLMQCCQVRWGPHRSRGTPPKFPAMMPPEVLSTRRQLADGSTYSRPLLSAGGTSVTCESSHPAPSCPAWHLRLPLPICPSRDREAEPTSPGGALPLASWFRALHIITWRRGHFIGAPWPPLELRSGGRGLSSDRCALPQDNTGNYPYPCGHRKVPCSYAGPWAQGILEMLGNLSEAFMTCWFSLLLRLAAVSELPLPHCSSGEELQGIARQAFRQQHRGPGRPAVCRHWLPTGPSPASLRMLELMAVHPPPHTLGDQPVCCKVQLNAWHHPHLSLPPDQGPQARRESSASSPRNYPGWRGKERSGGRRCPQRQYVVAVMIMNSMWDASLAGVAMETSILSS